MSAVERATPGPGGPPAGPLASIEVQVAVTSLLALESEALDARRYKDWLSLVTADFTYQVPIPVQHEGPFAPWFDASALLIDDTKESLTTFWFARLDEEHYELAWGDHPPVRERHFISNVRVRAAADGVLDVRSNVRLRLSRQTTQVGELTAERFDTVVWQGDDYKLASRFAVLDDLVLDAPRFRVIL